MASMKKAHKHCVKNINEIEDSETAGCFSCVKIFDASEISDYSDDGKTAVCPYCDTDAVIGDASGISFDEDFLQKMHEEYFGDPEDDEDNFDEDDDDDDKWGDVESFDDEKD